MFKYSVGPWNVHEGADAYGPATRDSISFEEKLKRFKEIGIDAIQFHDDDAVPNMNNLSEEAIIKEAKGVKELLDTYGLKAEFVAPRLWMDPHTIDGGFTSNSKEDREFALWRAKRSIDIANALGCDKTVLWLAREGTICPESKNPVEIVNKLVDALNVMLNYDSKIKIMIETKPNEPIDRNVCPTLGHALAVSAASVDPSRVGALLETAHAVLAGLDPASEMAFALSMGKLWGVHLNDQNGMKFDEDKNFGAENLRSAFNQIKVLKENNFCANGEYIGLDVKAMRTQKSEDSYRHIETSLKIAKAMEEKVNRYDYAFANKCIEERNYEALECYVLELIMGLK